MNAKNQRHPDTDYQNTLTDHYNHEVGYRNPPAKTRFKRGISGNPAGRPKNSKNLKSAVKEIYTDLVNVQEGQKTRRITRVEAVLCKQLERALKGDERAAIGAIRNALQFGILEDSSIPWEPKWDLTVLTDEELDTLDHLIRKITKQP